MHNAADHTGWPAGWTLSAPLHELFRETTSPLSVTLDAVAGSLNLASPDAFFRLSIAQHGQSQCQTAASGFRITCSSDARDTVCSAVMVDPTCLIIEADRAMLEPVLAQPGFKESLDEAFYFSEEGQHRLGILADIKSIPMRMAVVSGTGERDIMGARARGHLNKSAHTLIDGLLGDAPETTGRPGISPLQVIYSRMRSATSYIPYPWLADQDEEPVWDLVLVYPVFRMLLDNDPRIAGGLIQNYLELMTADGQLPIAGGNIGKPIFETMDNLLLISMCAAYYQQVGKLTGETGTILAQLETYLNPVINACNGTDNDSASLTIRYLQMELMHFRSLAHAAGKLSSSTVQRVLRRGIEALKKNENLEPREYDPFFELATLKRPKAGTDSDVASLAEQTSACVLKAAGEHDAVACSLVLIAADNFMSIDYRSYSRWVSNLYERVQASWEQLTDPVSAATRELYRRETLALAGMLTTLERQKNEAFDSGKLREQKILLLFERNRKWLIGGGILLAAALITFTISVQLRQSMPQSVYDTQLGMLMQHYQSGEFADALQKVSEMEDRGARDHFGVRYMKAKSLYHVEQFEAAASNFIFCIEKNPDNPRLYYNLAMCKFRMGQYDEAIQLFREILENYRRTNPSVAAYAEQAIRIIQENHQNPGSDPQKGEERGAPRRSG